MSEPTPPKECLRRARSLLRGSLTGLVLLTASASVLGLAADAHWVLFFLDQPRVHYVAGLLLGVLFLGLRRRWILTVVALGALVLNAWLLLPAAVHAARGEDPRPDACITVVHANLGQRSAPSRSLVAWIAQQRPDVVLFQEVTPPFLDAARRTFDGYLLLRAEARADTRGVAAFGRSGLSVEASEVIRFAAVVTDRPSVALRLAMPEGELALLSFHTKRPKGAGTLAVQAAEYADLAAWFEHNATRAAVALGDFNATPWSRRVRNLLVAADLPSAQPGLGLRPTWPSGPLGSLGIPIDLTVCNRRASVLRVEVGPAIGSDHRPICCTIAVAAPSVRLPR